MEKGTCAVPPPFSIDPGKSDEFKFVKTPSTACGSVAVFTYDLLHKDTKQFVQKIAVMFSVPFNFNFYYNWFAVGVFDQCKQYNYELYHEMYYEDEVNFVRGKACDGGLSCNRGVVTIEATMSDAYQPVMKIKVTA